MSAHFGQRGWRLLRWFFDALFRAMSDAFGDPVPPEVQVFEARAEGIQQFDRGTSDRVRADHAQAKALKG